MKMAQLNKRKSEVFLRAISFQFSLSSSPAYCFSPLILEPTYYIPIPGLQGLEEGTSAFLSSFPSLPQTLGTAEVPERISPQGI